MTETIKVQVDDALARRFRKKAMETYGYKKGNMKKALEDLIRKYAEPGKTDWSSLRGTLKKHSKLTSVELQHQTWSKLD